MQSCRKDTILVYDGQGFWLCQKRLSSGRFAFWPDGTAPLQPLQACELQVLLMAGDPARTRAAPAWRRLAA
jgi:transposase